MQTSFTLRGVEQLQAALARTPKRVIRETQQVLVMTARQLAAAYAEATIPPRAGGEKAADAYRARIEAEQSYLYATRENHRLCYALIAAQSEELAAAYWHAIQTGKPRQANRILQAAGVPVVVPTAAESIAARTGRRRRIPSNIQPLGLVQANQLRTHVRERTGRVGLAKAGWLASALSLGGRLRQGGKVRLPSYVRALARKHPNAGGSLIRPGKVTIYTRIRYAEAALPIALKNRAEAQARYILGQELKTRIAKINAAANRDQRAA